MVFFAGDRRQSVGYTKTRSLPLPKQKQSDHPIKRSKIINQCHTPSTEDNTSQITRFRGRFPQVIDNNQMKYNKMIVSWQIQINELFLLIYVEDYSFIDLKEYFIYSLYNKNLSSFYQALQDSIRNYLQRIRENIQQSFNEVQDQMSFSWNSQKYTNIITIIHKSYQILMEKAKEINKIINYFSANNNCQELHTGLFFEVILKDEAIKAFLDKLTTIFARSKFHQSSFSNAFEKLNRINLLRHGQTPKAFIVCSKQMLRIPRELNVTIQTQDSELYVSPKDIRTPLKEPLKDKEPLKQSKKPKKKRKLTIIDEVREFEMRLDLEYEQSRVDQKLEIELGVLWIAKLQSKLSQALKSLHYS